MAHIRLDPGINASTASCQWSGLQCIFRSGRSRHGAASPGVGRMLPRPPLREVGIARAAALGQGQGTDRGLKQPLATLGQTQQAGKSRAMYMRRRRCRKRRDSAGLCFWSSARGVGRAAVRRRSDAADARQQPVDVLVPLVVGDGFVGGTAALQMAVIVKQPQPLR